MKIHSFSAIYPNLDLVASSDSFFGTVKEDYQDYYKSGFFQAEKEPAIYILEIRTGEKVHTGVIACLDIEDYSKGRIVRHEDTIASSEQSMLKLLLQRGAMVKPILVCHPQLKDITKELARQKKKQKPFLQITMASGPFTYNLYQLKDKEGEALKQLFKTQVPKLYIADGHHRCSVGEKLLKLQGSKKGKDYSLILAAMFSFDQLDILDYNRVVQLPFQLKLTRFISDISKFCDIEWMRVAAKPSHKHEITMYLHGDWYKLTWKAEVLKKYKKQPAVLDAFLLDKEILEGLLGITDVRIDPRVSYVPGSHEATRVEEKAGVDDHHVGFCIYPVSFPELVKVSDHKGTLPPKSTWFEPRMLNGLIVKSY